MEGELPSEKLNRRWTWKGWTALAAAGALVLGVGGAAIATGPLAPAPTPTPTVAVPHAAMCTDYRGDVCYTPEMEAAAARQEQQIEAAQAAAAKAAADEKAAAQVQAQKQQQTVARKSTTQSPTTSGQPAGTPLPMVTVTDPNNGNYGKQVPSVDPASWCADHSASTINGVPTCD